MERRINLVAMLCEFNRCDPFELHAVIRENYEQNLNFLKTLNLYTNHLKNNILIRPNFVSNIGANQVLSHRGYKGKCNQIKKTLTFFRQGLTVDQYYFARYNIDLEYPHLPCVGMLGGSNHVSFFPIELLDSVEKIILESTAEV
jgi:hypothetical protein